MIDRKLLELPGPASVKPELEIMLSGCVSDAERKAVREAFYTFAQGDPGSFSVQFAVLLQAHARVLKCAPERLRKALEMELTPVTDVISSNRLALSTSASAIARDAADIHDQVVQLAEFNRELRAMTTKMYESEGAAREKFVAGIARETRAMQKVAESILSVNQRWILVVIITVYLVGIASYPVFAVLISWLEKYFELL